MEPRRATAELTCERNEWRAVARPLLLALAAFRAASLYALHFHPGTLDWFAAVPYAVGVGWLFRALVGWRTGRTEAMAPREAATFREQHFWSRAARYSYAAVVLSDGFLLLESSPAGPSLYFAFAVLAGLFAPEVGVIAVGAGVYFLL